MSAIGLCMGRLTHLDLSNRPTHIGNNGLGVQGAGDIVKNCKKLVSLNIGMGDLNEGANNGIGDQGIRILAEALPELEILRAPECEISNAGVHSISALKNLSCLDLSTLFVNLWAESQDREGGAGRHLSQSEQTEVTACPQ